MDTEHDKCLVKMENAFNLWEEDMTASWFNNLLLSYHQKVNSSLMLTMLISLNHFISSVGTVSSHIITRLSGVQYNILCVFVKEHIHITFIKYIILFLLVIVFYYCSSTVIFILPPAQHMPQPCPSPTLNPIPLWLCLWVLYTCSLKTLPPFLPLTPPTSSLVTVSLFLISMSLVLFCLFVCFVD